MDWLLALDRDLFRFGNEALSNPLFDAVMPFFSGNPFFVPVALVLGIWMLIKGGTRGRLCIFFLILAVAIGDGIICKSLKEALGRPRPFNDIEDTIMRVGKGGSGSLPSSHAANWFAGLMVFWLFYRRSWRIVLPIACIVAFSRVYNGVHYPSDVIAGALLGAAYAFAIVHVFDLLWQTAGKKLFPLWYERLPSLLLHDAGHRPVAERSAEGQAKLAEAQWLRLAYVLIAVIFLARIGYHAAGKIELTEDEAYQWQWAKHPALSYYSKPPMIAYTQWLGTSIFGDNELGVRFFSAVLAALMSVILLRFFYRELGLRPALWAVVLPLCMPLVAVGSILMTIDPLNVFFWMLAMMSGWRAVQTNSTNQWLLVGLWMGLGFLSKATALFQLLSWAVFFVLWPSARACLRSKGPWLALVINALASIPVLIWNAQHGWATVKHLENRSGLDRAWDFNPNFIIDFIVVEPLLFNPLIFIGIAWAAVAFWKKDKGNQLMTYCFSMGAPLFLFYFLYTIRARVQPNWIAPAILPLLCLGIIYWEHRWREGVRWFKPWLIAAFFIGFIPIVLMHDTNLTGKLFGKDLPAKKDPLRRVRGAKELAAVVETARQELIKEGKPVFIIGGHYGVTGLMAFYHPEARKDVVKDPLVFYRWSDKAENQFYFWPSYKELRKGQNAIYVIVENSPQAAPQSIIDSFESVKDLGIHEVAYRGRVFHHIQMYECRNLR
ncbi:MAG: arnT [Verrucomicrobia bacterium]|jgi:membrane-associated phospholipid phosphatase|nr:arnT [Verrucomicrobiota bacterium]